ncbi:hypothetical protein [Novipirellula artificiosorum]|uniref:Uncharacterized protein n=1 Tax=Novipirellula artificiosorum TaxID=2528016 RepID=A0A5C6E0T6_9BACT|nr:hypothetical protein [Novipirellula artificiosorum]TWU42470.1 hypothetical protein Poly41_07670 [Novipirellula artificiosorum]
MTNDTAETSEPIRRGSPFATDPPMMASAAVINPEDVYFQATPLRYTAMGAVAASAMVLFFAAAAAWWFPTGGAMIAGLGCMLSIAGLYSHRRKTAAALLAIHLMLFMLCFSQTM